MHFENHIFGTGKKAVEEAIFQIHCLVTHEKGHLVDEPQREFSSVPAKSLSFAAQDHAVDLGITGATSHKGSDLSAPAQRMARYGCWHHFSGECIWYGHLHSQEVEAASTLAMNIIDDLLIDDGVADRGHRLCLLNLRLVQGGVGIFVHSIFGHCVVIDMVNETQEELPEELPADEAELIVVREKFQRFQDRLAGKTGPVVPSEEAQTRARAEVETQWKVLGICFRCKDKVRGGRVVNGKQSSTGKEIIWHEKCFRCGKCDAHLGGQTYVEVLIDGFPAMVCKACYGSDFAPLCAECNERIVDCKTLRIGDKLMHPQCRKPAIKSAPGSAPSSSPALAAQPAHSVSEGSLVPTGSKTKRLKPKPAVSGASQQGATATATAAAGGGAKTGGARSLPDAKKKMGGLASAYADLE